MVIFADWAGYLVGLDKENGEQVWSYKPETENTRATASRYYIVEYEGVIYYTPGISKTVRGVDAYTGELVWSKTLESSPFAMLPSIDGLCALITLEGDGGDTKVKIAMLDLEAGEFLWRDDRSAFFPNAETNGLVVFGDREGVLHGLDPRTAEERWRVAVLR